MKEAKLGQLKNNPPSKTISKKRKRDFPSSFQINEHFYLSFENPLILSKIELMIFNSS